MIRILFLLSALLGLSEPETAQFGTVQRYKKISEVSGEWPGGLDPNDQLGRAVVSPGDIDGDGHADLVSGAIGDDARPRVRMKLSVVVTFLNKGAIIKELIEVPNGSLVVIDTSDCVEIDHDIV